MTWPFSGRAVQGLDSLIPQRGASAKSSTSYKAADRGTSLTHSAVWAGLRLRADIISSLPVDVFRLVDEVQMEMAKPSVMVEPASGMEWPAWMWASQLDLDSAGNHISLILEWNSLGKPNVLQPVSIEDVTVLMKGWKIKGYRIGKTEYKPAEVWHERQYMLSGVPVGLSPIAYAAKSLGGYHSARDFALDWFTGSATPSQHLKNTAKVLDPKVSDAIKKRYKSSVSNGDVFVTGADWELKMLSATASESAFLEQQTFSLAEACRFIGVPGDMIDVESSSGSITYANITQRNLQLLTINLGPAILRRESAFTRGLLPAPRFAKLNRGAVLAMDLAARYESYGVGIEKRFLAPSEARALENRPPFTPEQEAEFGRLFGSKTQPPVAAKEATA